MIKKLGIILMFLLISITSIYSTGTQESQNEEIKSDKSIKLVIATEVLSADPNDMERGDALVFAGNVCQTLTDIDPYTSEVTPLLALSWEQSNSNTWLFHLRKGVKFQDGTPFNAESVVFSVNRALNNTKIANTDKSKVAETVMPSVVDDYTVKLVTDVFAPNLPREMAYCHISSPTATPADKKTDNPIGTGPYKFVEWKRGQYIQVVRWDGYWGEKPEVEKATVVFRDEASIRAQMVIKGEADLAVPITPEFATNDGRTVSFLNSSTFFLRLPLYVPPFDDIRVRQAVQYAVDKEAIAKYILNGTGVASNNCLPESNNGFIIDDKYPKFDPEKAKTLLEAAKKDGVDVSREVRLVGMINQFPYSSEVLQYVTQNLNDVGFNIKLNIAESASWVDTLFHNYDTNMQPTILSVKHRNAMGDASPTLAAYAAKDGMCSESQDLVLDSMISDAQKTLDSKSRAKAFQDAFEYLYTKDISLVPELELRSLMIISDRINYVPNSQSYGMQLKLSDISFN